MLLVHGASAAAAVASNIIATDRNEWISIGAGAIALAIA